MRVSEVHAAESVACLNRALVRLQDIWEEIGIPEEQRVQRTNDVHKHIKGLLDLMIAEEEELKQRLKKSMEFCRKELCVLCTELQVPSYEEKKGSTMLQMEDDYRKRLEIMQEEKKRRMEDLKSLIAKDSELCDIMCTSPFAIDKNAVPSLKQLESYQAFLDEQTKEMYRRREEFVGLKNDIALCMNDLEHLPETSFETDVMCVDEDKFCLSDDNIGALRQLLSQLQERKTERELCCSNLRTKIQELWRMLQIPPEKQEELSEHMVHSKKRNVEALQEELQHLEELKMQNMKSFTEAVRVDIALLWQKCFYSEEQKQAFSAYTDEDFSEELLNLHETEVKNLKTYFEDHKELFEGVTKWQDNWTLYIELDAKATDPSRFNNRGGNLLKEEKQRSELQKSLPKLEKSLRVQIDAWEQEHNKDFLVNGQKFLDYVQQQWDGHHAEKEKEKLERQMKKSKQIQEELLYGTTRTPAKRRIGGVPTPGKLRKLNGTSNFSPASSFMNSGMGSVCYSSSHKLPPASRGLGLRVPGHGRTPRTLDRNKENISHPRNTPVALAKSQDHTFTSSPVAGSYLDFARDFATTSKTNGKSGLLNSTVSHQ